MSQLFIFSSISSFVRLVSCGGAIAFLLGCPLSSPSWSQETDSKNQTEIATLPQSDRHLSQLVELTHQEVNKYRTSLGLAPLKFDALISEQAQIHSANMAKQLVEFSHDGFQGRVDSLKDKISYGGAAENVAYNMGYQDPVDTAVAGWIKSDGHRKNMEGNYNLTGIGVAINEAGEYYFTQIFILEN